MQRVSEERKKELAAIIDSYGKNLNIVDNEDRLSLIFDFMDAFDSNCKSHQMCHILNTVASSCESLRLAFGMGLVVGMNEMQKTVETKELFELYNKGKT